MNKQFAISVVVLFVVTMLGGMVVHGTLLAVAKQIVLDILVLVVVGIVAAFVNRDPVARRA